MFVLQPPSCRQAASSPDAPFYVEEVSPGSKHPLVRGSKSGPAVGWTGLVRSSFVLCHSFELERGALEAMGTHSQQSALVRGRGFGRFRSYYLAPSGNPREQEPIGRRRVRAWSLSRRICASSLFDK